MRGIDDDGNVEVEQKPAIDSGECIRTCDGVFEGGAKNIYIGKSRGETTCLSGTARNAIESEGFGFERNWKGTARA